MTDLILIAVLAVICGAAAGFIYKEKKRGVKCVGCPMAESCASCKGGSCGGCGHD